MTTLARIKGMAADLKVVDVKSVKRTEFITEKCPETRTRTIKFYHEGKLTCGHYEYRHNGRMHDAPKKLACAACTGRGLTLKERAISE